MFQGVYNKTNAIDTILKNSGIEIDSNINSFNIQSIDFYKDLQFNRKKELSSLLMYLKTLQIKGLYTNTFDSTIYYQNKNKGIYKNQIRIYDKLSELREKNKDNNLILSYPEGKSILRVEKSFGKYHLLKLFPSLSKNKNITVKELIDSTNKDIIQDIFSNIINNFTPSIKLNMEILQMDNNNFKNVDSYIMYELIKKYGFQNGTQFFSIYLLRKYEGKTQKELRDDFVYRFQIEGIRQGKFDKLMSEYNKIEDSIRTDASLIKTLESFKRQLEKIDITPQLNELKKQLKS